MMLLKLFYFIYFGTVSYLILRNIGIFIVDYSKQKDFRVCTKIKPLFFRLVFVFFFPIFLLSKKGRNLVTKFFIY